MLKTWIRKKRYSKYFVIFVLLVLLLSTTTIQSQKMADDDLDQEQTTVNEEVPIYINKWGAQSFKPTFYTVTRIQLLLKQKGNIVGNLTISIRSSLAGSDIITVSIPTENITTEPDWVNIEFNDISVLPQNSYYILCHLDEGNENNNIVWYRGTNTTYDGGVAYYSEDNGSSSSWIQNIDKDFCFKTYGKTVGGEFEILYLVGKADFPGGRIEFAIKNTGNSSISPIFLQTIFTGGLLLTKSFTEKYDIDLKPGQIFKSEIYPIIGVGNTRVTISIWTTDGIPKTITADAFLFLFYVYVRSWN